MPNFPDKKRVDQLMVRARELIDTQNELRTEAKLLRVSSKGKTNTRNRLLRLLYDAMTHLSDQGLAAYPEDATREARYRLDHVYGRAPSKVGDPGAGGTEGVRDASSPAADEV